MVQAHAHARNAVFEASKAGTAVASEEHELAAGEFAKAAKSTGDLEVSSRVSLMHNVY